MTPTNAGWTLAKDALPEWEPSMLGCQRTVPVIVTDGYSRAFAYTERWDEVVGKAKTSWYDVGPDAYEVSFDVLYWHPLPSLPELPATGEQDA